MSIGNEDFAPLRRPETAEARRGNLESLSRKKKGENKNRFSEKQVKMLEGIFETETRIEAVKKVQLARELGLEPRQVAIWFQNRRARWKSKQLEKEYRVLVANYENLASLVGSLKEENHSLHAQVQSLSLGMEKPGQSGGNESENDRVTAQRGANRGLKVPEMRWEVVQEFVRMDEVGESSQASTDKERCGADQPCGAEQWWDLWSC